LELALLRWASIPEQLIEDYLDMKMNLHSWVGPLATMRFSGEFATFLFNTLTNAAIFYTQYAGTDGVAVAFGGDDLAANAVLREHVGWHTLVKYLPMEAKPETTDSPVFVSWRLTSRGIFKDPVLIALRLATASERLITADVIASYFLEHSFLYRRHEEYLPYLDELDHEALSVCNRTFHRHQKLIPGYRLFLRLPEAHLREAIQRRVVRKGQLSKKTADAAMDSMTPLDQLIFLAALR
jgi:hypothetical protein